MNKIQAKRLLASAGKTAGVVVQIRAGKGNADEIRVLNSSRKEVLASGTIALDASKKGYRDSDLKQVLAQVRSLNASRRKMNCSEGDEDVNSGDFGGDDAEFVDDVESIVTDDQGNEVQVDEMLVVQDPETSEIALFIPTDEDEQLPENLEVIGEVLPSDDAAVLDSSRRVKSRGRKMNASKAPRWWNGDISWDELSKEEQAEQKAKFKYAERTAFSRFEKEFSDLFAAVKADQEATGTVSKETRAAIKKQGLTVRKDSNGEYYIPMPDSYIWEV